MNNRLIATLAAGALLASSQSSHAQDQPTSYYYLDEGRRIDLEPNPTAIVLAYDESNDQQAPAEIAAFLGDAWTHRVWSPGHTLFELRDPGAPPEGYSLDQTIASLVQRFGDRFFYSPLFGDATTGFVLQRQFIVASLDGVPDQEAETILTEAGARIVKREHARTPGWYVAEVSAALTAAESLAVVNAIATETRIRWSVPDRRHVLQPSGPCTPLNYGGNDTMWANSWWLKPYNPGAQQAGINVAAAWNICGGWDASNTPLVKVSVLGDGVQRSTMVGGNPVPDQHPDLLYGGNYKILAGYNYTGVGDPDDGSPQIACDFHETIVTGIINMTHDNAQFNVGVAPPIEVYPLRFGQAMQTVPNCTLCSWTTQDSWLSSALSDIFWIWKTKVNNLSWNFGQGLTPDPRATLALLHQGGYVVVVSSGNGNGSPAANPADLKYVIPVGATDKSANRWPYSNRATAGYQDSVAGNMMGLMAPSGATTSVATDPHIYSIDDVANDGADRANNPLAGCHNSYVYNTNESDIEAGGTSFAAPQVTGTVALMFAQKPTLHIEDVREILCYTAHHRGTQWLDDDYGCGVVDAGKAVALSTNFMLGDPFEQGDTARWDVVVP